MSPRGSKCARVSGSKAVPALEENRRSSGEPRSYEENDKEEPKTEERSQDRQDQREEQKHRRRKSVQESAEKKKKKTSTMTMKRRKRKKRKRKPGRAKTTPETDAEATVAAAAMVVAAREGRSWLGARMRQPLESANGGLEQPRENGTLLQRRCTQSPHCELLPETGNLSSSVCSSRSSSTSPGSSYSRSSSVSSSEGSSPSSKTSENARNRVLLGKDRKREEKRRRGARECAREETKKQEGKEDTATEKEEEEEEEEKEGPVGELQTRSAPPITSTLIPPPAPSTSSTTTQPAPSLSPASSPSTSSEPLAASSPSSSCCRADSTNGISGPRPTTTNATTTTSSSTSTASSSSSSSPLESIRNALECYDRSRIYLAHVSFLDWRDLPGRRRGHSEDRRELHGAATSRNSGRSSGERVWVVGAADHDGHHRTRLLVAGRHWRPRCLSRVNMLSQPVVYAGGGRGSLTADLFLWWFHREFAVTAMAMHPDGAVLVAESADYLPPEGDCVAADGLVRLFVVPKDCLETRIVVRELRVRLAIGALTRVYHGVYRSKLSAVERDDDRLETYLRRFTLKEAFADLHRAWLSVRSETFARSWAFPREREDLDVRVGQAKIPGSSSIHRTIVASADREEDRMLLDELRGLAGELGLKVSDEELARWIVDGEERTSNRFDTVDIEDQPRLIKIECEHKSTDQEGEYEQLEDDDEEEEDGPTAEETVGLLTRVLTWMEREPLDPGLLLAVRSMRDIAAIMASKMGLAGTHPSGLPFFCPNGDHLTQPPPAHMGIPPYGALDAGKAAAAAGLTRAPMYPFSTGQYPYPMLSPEMTQVAASWHTPSMYPISPASAGFRSPYPTSLPITSSSLPSDLYRFSPTGLMPPHHGLGPHAHALASHALVSSAPKTDHSTLDHNHRSTIEQKNSTSLPADNAKNQDTGQQNNQDKKKPHIKKPLNAFMLYMKEMRAKVVAECTLKESAAINQILGRRWHSLSREEQARYYEAARQERHLHQQRYPGWSARDNYGYGSKKKKRKKERSADPTGGREEQAKYYELARRERQLHMQLYPDWSSRANTNRTKKRKRKQDTNSDPGGNNMKKCRARYGLDQQSQWCKPCRRKKKCIRYMGEGGEGDGEADGEGEDDHSEDNLGSVGEAGTPEEDESLSSPGGLSALSSLASPSLVLPSPSSLASPCPCPLTPPVPPPPNPSSQQQQQQQQQQQVQQQGQQPHRNPVGTNPHDINNPLSVNQLTGQCIKSEVVPAPPSGPSNPAISVT